MRINHVDLAATSWRQIPITIRNQGQIPATLAVHPEIRIPDANLKDGLYFQAFFVDPDHVGVMNKDIMYAGPLDLNPEPIIRPLEAYFQLGLDSGLEGIYEGNRYRVATELFIPINSPNYDQINLSIHDNPFVAMPRFGLVDGDYCNTVPVWLKAMSVDPFRRTASFQVASIAKPSYMDGKFESEERRLFGYATGSSLVYRLDDFVPVFWCFDHGKFFVMPNYSGHLPEEIRNLDYDKQARLEQMELNQRKNAKARVERQIAANSLAVPNNLTNELRHFCRSHPSLFYFDPQRSRVVFKREPNWQETEALAKLRLPTEAKGNLASLMARFKGKN